MKCIAKQKGFTLIEFVVIISIFAIMAGVALINFSGFRSDVALNNLAHDIALTIRQAQVFGWSTRTDNIGSNNEDFIQLENNSADGNPVRFAEGVHFKYENGSFVKEFILYTKRDSSLGNEYYVTSDRVVDTIKIQGPNHISRIQYADTKEALLLNPTDQSIPQATEVAGSFSIAFSRPRPEAKFFYDGIEPPNGDSLFVGIYISSDQSCPVGTLCNTADRVVTVSRFGEIAVE